MIALKKMTIVMAMVIEDSVAVTIAVMIEMIGAMVMLMLMALEEMTIAMAMVVAMICAVTEC
jgi:hypothetical protein